MVGRLGAYPAPRRAVGGVGNDSYSAPPRTILVAGAELTELSWSALRPGPREALHGWLVLRMDDRRHAFTNQGGWSVAKHPLNRGAHVAERAIAVDDGGDVHRV